MRKKIPTITRPDTAYSATLRQDSGKNPVGEEIGSTAARVQTANDAVTTGREYHSDAESVDAKDEPGREVERAKATDGPPLAAKGSPLTRKIDIRVNALARQEAALLACGVDPAHVVRAALRRAVKGWQLAPVFAPPSDERRTRNMQWQARTSLAVYTAHLHVLLRENDPLDVLSKWALIRGQVEPRIWAEIDALIEELKDFAAAPHDPDNAETTDIDR
ncbi:hypothetical protein [Roseicitreum antarcticum]|uniref:Uncharacterized protein n=1 Tax=Roseicitreum antarcticum TaxID=564137 RepID=A0A1H3DNZ4_9RHOB|nr:hypothetical protein [Roseicitreum antarcticum]SDX68077.1 hypothetical protein SAMN04488238_1159 [Roseicitreum antarcticum]